MKYEDIDFLEFFDIIEDVNMETGYVEYSVTSPDNITLIIFMNVYEGGAYFKLKVKEKFNFMTFELHNITSIVCERSRSDLVRFLFHSGDRVEPILIVIVKPALELILNI